MSEVLVIGSSESARVAARLLMTAMETEFVREERASNHVIRLSALDDCAYPDFAVLPDKSKGPRDRWGRL